MHIKPRASKRLLTCLVISMLLSACGGGGGGGGGSGSTPAPEPTPTPQPPPEPAKNFTLAGTISVSASQVVDSDTNDWASTPVDNNSPANAQRISNPVTLGGYINRAVSGAEGNSYLSGDTDDFYLVQLLAGQSVTMLVADFDAADADLYLLNSQGVTIDYSIETGEIETLLIPADGTYYIRIFAYAGATNYTLAIGAPGTVGANSRQHHDFVPWQMLVQYRGEGVAADMESTAEAVSRRLGMRQRAGGRGRSRLMDLRRNLAETRAATDRLGSAAALRDSFKDPDLLARWETLSAIKTLRRDPRVENAEPNYVIKALATPNDAAYPAQWHYPLIGLPQAWDTTTGSPEVIVGVIDTGVLTGHPDLGRQLVAGYDFVSNPANSGDGDGIDPNPRDPGNSSDAASSSYHGTHVSGTVAARGGNGIGVTGTAYTSRVMPVRALGVGGSGTSYDVEQAIRFAAGLANDSGTVPQQAADIINLSLGGGAFSQASQNLFNQVRAAGVIVVAAAGNEARSIPAYPASYSGVISVSAVDAQRRLSPYSNTGANIDIAAPGGDSSQDFNGDGYPDGVLSTGGSGAGSELRFVYSYLNGTSMATPHVAGVLALMKSVNPDLDPADIDALLASGALSDDLGAPGRDNQFGHGLVNAQRAVLAAIEASGSSPADNPRLVASASALNFGATATTLDLLLSNGGKGDLELLGLAVSQPWLSLTPQDLGADGLGLYRVSVDRDTLASGVYSANIAAQSTVNTVNISVFLSVASTASSGDVGVVYVLLYDTALDEPVAEAAVSATDGNYPFNFNDIAPGQYQVFAGSDADNDLLICDPGEACGAFLTIDQPSRIELESDLADLDFPVEYLVSLPDLAGNAAAIAAPTVAKKRPSPRRTSKKGGT